MIPVHAIFPKFSDLDLISRSAAWIWSYLRFCFLGKFSSIHGTLLVSITFTIFMIIIDSHESESM